MRVWVIFLLIFVISLTTAKNQKAASSKKSVPVDKSDEDKNYLPPIGDGDPEVGINQEIIGFRNCQKMKTMRDQKRRLRGKP